MTLLWIIVRPAEAVARFRKRPSWIASFLALTVVGIALLMLRHPEAVRLTLEHLPASATGADHDRVRSILDRELTFRCLFLPVRLLIGWGSFAVLLDLGCRAFLGARAAGFRHFFALEVHAESTLLLSHIVVMIAQMFGMRTFEGYPPVHPISLAAMVTAPPDFVLYSLLGITNIFTLWYLILLVYGAAVFCDTRMRRALLPVIVVWLLSVGFDLGVTSLLRDALRLSL
jgi:hypothetical protein